MNLLPREKLKQHGPQALEDHELLAAILGRGSQNENVFQLSQRLLKGFDREELMLEKDLTTLKNNLQIGTVQTTQIMAAIELGRRFFALRPSSRQIRTTNDIYQVVKNMQYLKKEYLRGLFLNSRYKIIHNEIISIGSMDANIIHPREIFRPAIEYGAYAIILAHNHPSGDCKPSESDIKTSKKLQNIGYLLQIPLLDHLIIGENSYTSLSKEKILA